MPATAGLPTVDAADPAQIGEATQQAETGIAFVAVGFRVLVVTQILIAGVPTVQRLNPGPGAGYLLALSLILGCSIWACFSVMKKKSVRTGGWHWPDMIVGLVAFPLLAYCLPPQDYVGAWRFWAPGFAVNTVILAAAWMGLRGSVTYATLVALVDLAIVARAPSVTGFLHSLML